MARDGLELFVALTYSASLLKAEPNTRVEVLRNLEWN